MARSAIQEISRDRCTAPDYAALHPGYGLSLDHPPQ